MELGYEKKMSAIANAKKSTLKTIVTQNKVRSMPRRAVKTLPVSAPVNPPNPAPLLCKITLRIRKTDVIIKPICKYIVICGLLPKQRGNYTCENDESSNDIPSTVHEFHGGVHCKNQIRHRVHRENTREKLKKLCGLCGERTFLQ
jgi:hypothetical protein